MSWNARWRHVGVTARAKPSDKAKRGPTVLWSNPSRLSVALLALVWVISRTIPRFPPGRNWLVHSEVVPCGELTSMQGGQTGTQDMGPKWSDSADIPRRWSVSWRGREWPCELYLWQWCCMKVHSGGKVVKPSQALVAFKVFLLENASSSRVRMTCRVNLLAGKSEVDTESDLSCRVCGPWSLQEWLALQEEWKRMQKPCFCWLKNHSWRLLQHPVAYRLDHWVLPLAKLQWVAQEVLVAWNNSCGSCFISPGRSFQKPTSLF